MSCLVIRIKQMIIHSNLSEIKSKILPTCLQGKYRHSLGEFSKTSYGVLRTEHERVKVLSLHVVVDHLINSSSLKQYFDNHF